MPGFLLRSRESELRSLYLLKHLPSSYSKMALELRTLFLELRHNAGYNKNLNYASFINNRTKK